MRFNIYILGCFIALVGVAHSATYYVSPSGDDSNDGSIGSPWKLPGKFNVLQPGDTGYFRAGTYDNPYIHGANNPGADFSKHVTLAAYPGEEVIISGTPTYGLFFNLFSASFLIDGLKFDACGEPAIWMLLDNADNSILRNTYFGECDNTALQVRLSNNVTIHNNTFYKSGNALDQGESDNVYVLGSTHVLFEYNYFSYGAHAAIDVIEFGDQYSSHIIMQKNVVDSYWGGGFYVHRGTTHAVIQDNIFRYAGAGTTYPKTGVQIAQELAIVRRNIISQSDATNYPDHCMVLNAFVFQSRNLSCVHNRIYNNIMYECGYYALKVNQKQYALIVDNIFLNNIMYKSKEGGDYEEYYEAGNYTIGFESYHAEAQYKWGEKFAEGVTYFESNIILNADNFTDKPNEVSLFWLETSTHRWTLTEAEELYPKVFKNNYEFNPGWVDAKNGDFNLRSDSQSIDAGSHLTKTTSAGSSTTTIQVEDPYYFIDGYDLIDGDMIQVGSNSPVMVTNVDFGTKTLTVDTAISFNMGDFVSLAYNGDAPDLGPFEYKMSSNAPSSGPSSTSAPTSNSPLAGKVNSVNRSAPTILVLVGALLAF
jgi:hypothetical protein